MCGRRGAVLLDDCIVALSVFCNIMRARRLGGDLVLKCNGLAPHCGRGSVGNDTVDFVADFHFARVGENAVGASLSCHTSFADGDIAGVGIDACLLTGCLDLIAGKADRSGGVDAVAGCPFPFQERSVRRDSALRIDAVFCAGRFCLAAHLNGAFRKDTLLFSFCGNAAVFPDGEITLGINSVIVISFRSERSV